MIYFRQKNVVAKTVQKLANHRFCKNAIFLVIPMMNNSTENWIKLNETYNALSDGTEELFLLETPPGTTNVSPVSQSMQDQQFEQALPSELVLQKEFSLYLLIQTYATLANDSERTSYFDHIVTKLTKEIEKAHRPAWFFNIERKRLAGIGRQDCKPS
jgi:hypothetical protein